MLSKDEFVRRILDGAPPEAEAEADAGFGDAMLEGFDTFDVSDDRPTAEVDTRFAQLLLEECGFGAGETLPRNEVVLGEQRTNPFLPPGITYWPKLGSRPFHILLLELDKSASEIMSSSFPRARDELEDVLHRMIQDALEGFERGGSGRTADRKQGAQNETLCVISVADDRARAEPRQVVCFGTKATETDALEVFYLREEARDWERALAEEHLAQLYERHFKRLASGSKWQDAFISGEERRRAKRLMQLCEQPTPDSKVLQETVRDLLDEIAKSFGVKRKSYRGAGGQSRLRLPAHALPVNHSIAANPEEARRADFKNPFQGFRVFDAEERLLGYIVYVLDQKEDAQRLRTRLEAYNHFHNVLVVYPETAGATLELWQGTHQQTGRLLKGARRTRFDGEGGVVQLLSRFFVVSRTSISTPSALAQEIGHRSKHLRRLALDEVRREEKLGRGQLFEIYNGFNKSLERIDHEKFADVYAQTISYGLLAARWLTRSAQRRFTRSNVADYLPKTSQFLHDLFEHLVSLPFDTNLTWLLDDLVSLLSRTEVASVFEDESDPVIHFYETFLHEYDPELKRLRGVYYTPDPAVRFVVGAVDRVVARQLDDDAGLASIARWDKGPQKGEFKVQVLDPACGTGTFLKHVITRVHRTFSESLDPGMDAEQRRQRWVEYVRQSLAPRLFGFEVLVAPYVVCHLQLSLTLVETGIRIEELPRLNVFLANTLVDPKVEQPSLPGQDFLTEEARAAVRVKSYVPVSVIVGNPPYSPSVYEDPWILDLIEEYKRGLNEKKLDLNREEWKFLRYAHHRVEQQPIGAIGFVINRSFLDGVTSRRMRESLGSSFSYRLIVDLNGDVKGRTVLSEHGKDENIFEIEQGVCAAILGRTDPEGKPRLRYLSLAGPAEYKYEWLRDTTLDAAEADALEGVPKQPYFLWTKNEATVTTEFYDMWPKISEVFQVYSSGIQTKRDKLSIHFTRAELLETVKRFASLGVDEARREFAIGKDGRDWTVANAQADLLNAECSPSHAVQILYRPFDVRWTFYTGKTKGFLGYPRREVMQHFVGRENIGLISNRQVVSTKVTHFGFTRIPNTHGTFYLGNKGQDYLFPLFRYEEATPIEKKSGIAEVRRVNIKAKYLKQIARSTDLAFRSEGEPVAGEFSAMDVLAFIAAVFHSDAYRERYDERLHIDFPRVPFTPSQELFLELLPLGRKIISAHTVDSSIAPPADIRLHDGGSRVVEKIPSRLKPLPADDSGCQIPINKTSWFSGITDADWTFEIGGYQPVHKWLEARKKETRSLDASAVDEYRHLVGAIRVLRDVSEAIDACISRFGGWPNAFREQT